MMTRRVGDVIYIQDDEGQTGQCDSCGEIKDLRPYGINRAVICYECGEKLPNHCADRMLNITLFDGDLCQKCGADRPIDKDENVLPCPKCGANDTYKVSDIGVTK